MKTRRSPEVKVEPFVCAAPLGFFSLSQVGTYFVLSSVNVSRAKEATLGDP